MAEAFVCATSSQTSYGEAMEHYDFAQNSFFKHVASFKNISFLDTARGLGTILDDRLWANLNGVGALLASLGSEVRGKLLEWWEC